MQLEFWLAQQLVLQRVSELAYQRELEMDAGSETQKEGRLGGQLGSVMVLEWGGTSATAWGEEWEPRWALELGEV